MGLNKTQLAILKRVNDGPFEFDAEWIIWADIPRPYNTQYCIRGHQMYWGANGLQSVKQVKLTELSRRPGKDFAVKYCMSGPTEIITFRVEK